MPKNFADYGKPDNSPEALAVRETNRDRALTSNAVLSPPPALAVGIQNRV